MNKQEFIAKWEKDDEHHEDNQQMERDLEEVIKNEREEAIEEYKLTQLGSDEED